MDRKTLISALKDGDVIRFHLMTDVYIMATIEHKSPTGGVTLSYIKHNDVIPTRISVSAVNLETSVTHILVPV